MDILEVLVAVLGCLGASCGLFYVSLGVLEPLEPSWRLFRFRVVVGMPLVRSFFLRSFGSVCSSHCAFGFVRVSWSLGGSWANSVVCRKFTETIKNHNKVQCLKQVEVLGP